MVYNILLIIRHVMPAFWIILGLFGLTISGYEPLSRRLPRRRILPCPRAPLHYLLTLVQPEVVSVLLQLSPQRLYRYYQCCYHFTSFFTRDIIPYCFSVYAPHIYVRLTIFTAS